MRYLKIIKMLLFYKPFSLNQYKYFCINIDNMGIEKWKEFENEIRSSHTLKKFFKIK